MKTRIPQSPPNVHLESSAAANSAKRTETPSGHPVAAVHVRAATLHRRTNTTIPNQIAAINDLILRINAIRSTLEGPQPATDLKAFAELRNRMQQFGEAHISLIQEFRIDDGARDLNAMDFMQSKSDSEYLPWHI